MTYILGIDAGGSKTVALLADSNGRILGRGTAGSCAFQAIPEIEVRSALRTAVTAAFAAAGIPRQPAAIIGLGVSGVDRPADHLRLQHIVQEESLGQKTVVTNDSELLLWCGELQGWGIGVISGTGSIVIGRTPEGKTTRAGGWGYRFGDEGSGFAIGTAALRAVAKAADGRGPQTTLSGPVLAHWGLQQPIEMIPHIYQGNLPYAQIAHLAALVCEAADNGDPAAISILDEAALELVQAVKAVHRGLGFQDTVPAAFGGGVLLKIERVRAGLVQRLAETGIRLEPLVLAEEPARGAVRMALESLSCSL